MQLRVMKPHLCAWLYKAWKHIDKKGLIQAGWKKCGITKAFDKSFQAHAVEENMITSLFNDNKQDDEQHMDNEQVEDIEPTTRIEDVMFNSIERSIDKKVATPNVFTLTKMVRYFDICSYNKI